jgi:hypothetical protein
MFLIYPVYVIIIIIISLFLLFDFRLLHNTTYNKVQISIVWNYLYCMEVLFLQLLFLCLMMAFS